MSFEVVVRPVVFPNIRPQAPRSLPPEDDPEKGFCVIRGNPAQSFDLSYSYSMSATSTSSIETQRQVDEVRVYQKEDDGTVNKDNFVDVEVANKIWKRGAAKPEMSTAEKAQRERDAKLYEQWIEKFRRQAEEENIEIRKRDQIRKNEEQDQ